LEKLVAVQKTDATLRLALVRTYNNLGFVHHVQTRRLGEALRFYEQARDVAEKLVRENPTVTAFQSRWADSYYQIGQLLRDLGQADRATMSLQKSIEIQENLAQTDPDYRNNQYLLALSYMMLGTVQRMSRRFDEGLASLQRACDILAKLIAKDPQNAEFRVHLGECYCYISEQLSASRKSGEAVQSYQRARELFEQLIRENRASNRVLSLLARTYEGPGDLQLADRQFTEAVQTLQQARNIREKLARDNPTNRLYQEYFCAVSCNLAKAQIAAGKAVEAQGTLQQARDALEKLPRTDAQELYTLACVRAQLSKLVGTGKPTLSAQDQTEHLQYADRAMDALRQAIASGFTNLAKIKKDPGLDSLRQREDFKQLLAALEATLNVEQEQLARLKRATDLANKGHHAQAAAEAALLAEAKPASAGLLYDTGCVYALCVAAVQKDAQTAAAEREKLAEDYARRAIALLRRAVQAGFNDLKHLKTGDPDLESLRSREDFQKLVAELEKSEKVNKR
jgi:tetratricopeptide (TPR) repeat protein